MTVQENITKVTVTGPLAVGDLIPIPFQYINENDIKVEVDGSAYIYNVDYEVTLQNVEIKTPVEGAVSVTVYRDTPLDQQAEFPQNNKFNSAKMNEALDKLCMIQQEHKEELDRCLRVAIDTASQFDGLLPSPSSGKALMWDAEGEIINTPFTMTEMQESVNTAVSNSAAALSGANSAVATANSASSTANTALSTANNAAATAEGAVTTANTALSTANTALSTADNALSTAGNAVATAEGAVTTADSALSVANTASATADDAVTTANAASATADDAVTTANAASSTADSASSTASQASSTANQALQIAEGKQDILISGINIKTINDASLLGSGDITMKYGADLLLSLNTTTYVLTLQLKDQDGNNLGTTQTIDLPIESLVLNVSFDSATNELIITLQSGSVVRVPLGSIIRGLQEEITSENKLSADLVDNGTVNKVVTQTEKDTWNGKQDVISDLSTIRSNATAGKAAKDAVDVMGDVVSHNASEFAGAIHTHAISDVTNLQTTLDGKQAVITSSNKLNADLLSEGSTNKLVSSTEKDTWNGKQDAISDLSTIRSNATAGAGAATTIAGYGNIVTHNANEFAGATHNHAISDVTNLQTTLDGKQAVITATNKLDADLLSEGLTNKLVSSAEKDTWNGKQNAISDLATIRSNASAGAGAATTIAGYGDVVSHDANEFAGAVHGHAISDVTNLQTTLDGKQANITSTNKLSADLVSDGTTNKTVTQAEKNTWNNKQNAISDLSTIRSGAGAGATAVQPGDLSTVAYSGSFTDLINTPSPVTESTVSGWGFTKNTGTVTKVNNITPVNGNVTLNIPDTSTLANKDLSNLSATGNSKFQMPLVSGVNIKTINGNSLLGNGNIEIQGGGGGGGDEDLKLKAGDYTAIGLEWAAPITLPFENINNVTWGAIAFDGTKYVMIGYRSYVTTSTDGITWTTPVQNLPTPEQYNQWTQLIYDGNKFVALHRYGHIATSTDGVTWALASQIPSSISMNYYSMAYNGVDKYVALGNYGGYVSTSTDGVTWTTIQQNLDSQYRWIVFYNGISFVALGGISGQTTNIVYSTSNDGVTWTTPVPTELKGTINSESCQVVYNGSKYVLFYYGVVVESSSDLVTSLSDDGIHWENPIPRGVIGYCNCIGVVSNNVMYTQSHRIYYSTGNYKVYTTYIAGDGIYIDNGKITNTHITTNWGEITGDSQAQKDLTMLLKGKQNRLIAGNNITLTDTTLDEWSEKTLIGTIFNKLPVGIVQDPMNPNEYIILFQNGSIGMYSNYNVELLDINTLIAGSNSILWRGLTMIGDPPFDPPFAMQLLAVAHNGRIARCSCEDIYEWEIIDTEFTNYSWNNIVYNPNDRKLNIYSYTGYMSSSTDEGSNWTTPVQTNPFAFNFNGKVAYGNGVYVAVATSSNKLYKSTSSDGETWTTATQINLISTVYENNYAFGFDGNYFILINSNGTILKTLDGDSWAIDETVSNLANKSWNSIAFDKYGTTTKAILLNSGIADWLTFSVKQAVEATIISCTQ